METCADLALGDSTSPSNFRLLLRVFFLAGFFMSLSKAAISSMMALMKLS